MCIFTCEYDDKNITLFSYPVSVYCFQVGSLGDDDVINSDLSFHYLSSPALTFLHFAM